MNETGSARSGARDTTGKVKEAANDMLDRAAETARDAANKARSTATDAKAQISDQVKELLNRQVGSGAELAGEFANSMRVAADELDGSSPTLAGLVRGIGDKVDDYATGLQDKTVDELLETASDFTRRQPALVFGLAALAGFIVFRTVKSMPQRPSPSIQPQDDDLSGEHHG